jgi:GNAT superfamily N-acetyltransferase
VGLSAVVAVREVLDDAAVRATWPLMWQLRPHYGANGEVAHADAYVEAVRRQRAEGYRLACAFVDDAPRALAGFRIQHMLSRGRFLYVDDLVTDEGARGTGVGTVLFDWLVAAARDAGCARLHLDSGVQRHAAHGFYFARRMHIQAHHFALDLGDA